MQEMSRRTRTRLLTDIAFATAMAAAASLSIAAAQAQTQAPMQQDNPAVKTPEELKSKDTNKDSKEPSTVGETRAAPEPRLPADQTQPPVSGKPLDEPGKELHSAPPEKIEGK